MYKSRPRQDMQSFILVSDAKMPAKKSKRTNALRHVGLPQPRVEEQEQPEDPPVNDDPVPGLEPEPQTEDAQEPARRKATPRVVTAFTEDQKEAIIDFLQQNPVLYSKRLTGYKNSAAKERLWMKQAEQMQCTPNELKTWYDSMRTKLGKLKKAASKSGQAADSFTATERYALSLTAWGSTLVVRM